MIRSKTYNGSAGLNYIEASELVFTTIYAVKLSGIQQDRYISGDGNRTYSYNQSQGRISFPNGFNSEGEKVFVIYKETGVDDTPPVCEMVAYEDSEMPDAVVNVSYSKGFPVTGTYPVTLNIITKPSWAAVELSLYSVLTVMGIPDVAGAETLEVELSNCGGTVTIVKTFETLPNSNNIFISSSSFARIDNVTGIDYVISGGSFPVFLGGVVSGIHNGYSGIISVAISSIIFPRTLKIYKNGVEQQSIAVTANGVYSFTPFTIFAANTINITLS